MCVRNVSIQSPRFARKDSISPSGTPVADSNRSLARSSDARVASNSREQNSRLQSRSSACASLRARRVVVRRLEQGRSLGGGGRARTWGVSVAADDHSNGCSAREAPRPEGPCGPTFSFIIIRGLPPSTSTDPGSGNPTARTSRRGGRRARNSDEMQHLRNREQSRCQVLLGLRRDVDPAEDRRDDARSSDCHVSAAGDRSGRAARTRHRDRRQRNAAGRKTPGRRPPPATASAASRSNTGAGALLLVLIAVGIVGYFVYQVATTLGASWIAALSETTAPPAQSSRTSITAIRDGQRSHRTGPSGRRVRPRHSPRRVRRCPRRRRRPPRSPPRSRLRLHRSRRRSRLRTPG